MNIENTNSNGNEKIFAEESSKKEKGQKRERPKQEIDIMQYIATAGSGQAGEVKKRELLSPRKEEEKEEGKKESRLKRIISQSSFRNLLNINDTSKNPPSPAKNVEQPHPVEGALPFDEDRAIFECIERLMELEVYKDHGVGRISGSASNKQHLLERYRRGEKGVVADCRERCDIISALKELLQKRRERLIPEELKEEFFSLSCGGGAARIKEFIDKLPENSGVILERICFFLSLAIKHVEATKMNAYNCAVCFAPCFVDESPKEGTWQSEKEKNLLLLERTNKNIALFERILEEYEALFLIPKPPSCALAHEASSPEEKRGGASLQ